MSFVSRAHARLTSSACLFAATSLLSLTACDGDEPTGARRVFASVAVSLEASTMEVGQTITASAIALDQHGARIDSPPAQWTSEPSMIAGVDGSGRVRAIAPGVARIAASIGGVAGEQSVTVSAPPAIRISRIITGGTANTGSIELFNPTSASVDLSSWSLIDDTFFGPMFSLPPRTSIAAGSSLVIQERSLPFGLDPVDDIRLLSRYGVEVDRQLWIVPR